MTEESSPYRTYFDDVSLIERLAWAADLAPGAVDFKVEREPDPSDIGFLETQDPP